MAGGEVHLLMVMMWGKQRVFLLHHSLHTSLFQLVTDSLGGDGLVGKRSEGLGNLYSIVSLPRVDKMKGMVDISG
jgi:hypothetical protein